MKRRLVFFPVVLWACAALQAHDPDTSYLRCRVALHELDLRFTFAPATLYRIVRADADGDGKITRAEMEAAMEDIDDYLEATVRLEINGEPVKLGRRTGIGWPAEAGDAIAEKDYHAMLVHFTFHCQSEALIEDFYLCFESFGELGDRHRIVADIEQGEKHEEVVFSLFEPDYLYDTFSGPDLKEVFRRSVAAVWSNSLLLLVLVPPFVLGALRRSKWLVALVALPGFGAMLWQLWRELPPASLLVPVSGFVAATVLGATIFLPSFLCLPRRGE